MPGRHPLREQNLADSVRAAFHFFVARHRKRSNVAWTVARNAALLQDRRDFGRVGDRF